MEYYSENKQRTDHIIISLKFLRTHSLFGGLSDSELKSVRSLRKRRCFAKGDTIIREGEPGDRLYFIHQGSVEVVKKITRKYGSGSKKLAVLAEGDTFGEMELIDIQPRAATVRAIANTETFMLSNADLYRISKLNIKTFTIIIMNLAREISRRLRKSDESIVNHLFHKKRKNRG
jgi:CRP/FNR family transcriptional regulator, cyclic AMP receptor protein